MVSAYEPVRHYGYCQRPDEQVYFHGRDFYRLTPGSPPPVLGEGVEIELNPQESGIAKKVIRITEPLSEEGKVLSYDSKKGWGFLRAPDGETVFLHVLDLTPGWIPIIGTRVRYYRGYKRGRARACWVQERVA